jgi:anti-anti-sigma factor
MQMASETPERSGGSASGRLNVTAQHGDRGCSIRLKGELDNVSAPELCAQLAPWLTSCRKLILDLREVSFMDSVGLRAILDLYRCLNERNVGLKLIEGDGGNVPRVLRHAGLESLIVRDECGCD